MIDSLFEEVNLVERGEQNVDDGDMDLDLSAKEDSEASFLAAMPVIHSIIRRKIAFSHQTDSSDIFQEIVLRLWSWRNRFRQKSSRMSPTEWRAFAAKTAYNEINRYFSSKKKFVSLDEVSKVSSSGSIAGETGAEIESLARSIWQGIRRLTLRQRRALLLHDQRSIIYLLTGGISDEELAKALEFTDEDWLEVKARLSSSDLQTSEFSGCRNRNNVTLNAGSVKKARHDARAKLRTIISK